MNNKLHQNQPSNNFKILVNGCSQSQAVVTDIHPNKMMHFSWPIFLARKLNCHLVNLATNGKDNLTILAEAQRYLINFKDINHVIIQLTSNNRITVFNNSASFQFIPKDPNSQFDRLSNIDNVGEFPGRYPRYYNKIELPCSIWKMYRGKKKEYKIGDSSLFYHRLNVATQLFNLYFYCKHNNIGLTVLPYDKIGEPDEIQDNVFASIPNNIFLQSNIAIGIFDHLDTIFPNNGGHFEKLAHEYLSEKVYDHVKENKQIEIDIDLIKRNKLEKIIYYYTE